MPWSPPPDELALPPDEVHAWLADLGRARGDLPRLCEFLGDEERERAGRLRDAEHRDGWAAGRGILREILGRYLNSSPKALEFRYGRYGKPALAGELASSDLHFNMS